MVQINEGSLDFRKVVFFAQIGAGTDSTIL
jgi:hypothetical protein